TAVAVGDLADQLEVALLRREAPAGVLHRLQDHGGNRVGPLEHDALLDLVGSPKPVSVGRPAIAVRVRNVPAAWNERLELAADAGEAGCGQCAERGAVIGKLPRDDLRSRSLFAQSMVVARQLQGRLDCLRAA